MSLIAKRVFLVNDTEENFIYYRVCFTCFDALLGHDDSNALSFVEELNEFTVEEFKSLVKKVMKLQTEFIQMEESQVIITVVVLNFVSHTFLYESENNILRDIAGETYDSFMSIRGEILQFTTYTIDYLKTHFVQFDRFAKVINRLESSC